ncbi:MAG: hexokinase, partial [Syntrophomonas sp.]|nr:hexokinase [Syntrophomonas sp.]
DSHFGRPSGAERGEALALDFGGSNLRLSRIRLRDRSFQTLQTKVINLRHNRLGQDLTAAAVDGPQLFDYIAAEIDAFAAGDPSIGLGHCFSFPFQAQDRNSGTLLEWTKEIKTGGVVGQDVNRLLDEALQRRGLKGIQTRALLNDTVATLLCAAYQDEGADIGSVCGTGHNSCFMDHRGRIINIEAGNFRAAVLPLTRYDEELDRHSSNRGHQRLEKMVAGAYLGELFRLMLLDLAFDPEHFSSLEPVAGALVTPASIDSRQMSSLLTTNSMYIGAQPWSPGPDELPCWQRLAEALVIRSGRLIAATYGGIVSHLDPGRTRRHLISIDGSLYEKMPGFAAAIRSGLDDSGSAEQTEVRLGKDSSGLGAALAAILTARP